MKYNCPKCNKQFNQKSHFTAHLKKKYNCEKCNINFETQYAYIDNKCIHIKNYNETIMK